MSLAATGGCGHEESMGAAELQCASRSRGDGRAHLAGGGRESIS